MRVRRLFAAACLSTLVFGCASTGGKAGQSGTELTFKLLTQDEARLHFKTIDAPCPFAAPLLYFGTQPTNFLTAEVFVPKDGVKKVEVGDMTVSSADGQASTDGLSKRQLLDYWVSMGFQATQRANIVAAIDKYALPETTLTGRTLGKSYGIVFVGREPFLATDKVSVTFFVDDEPKIFEFVVGAFAPKRIK
jgi:hypothetical protein